MIKKKSCEHPEKVMKTSGWSRSSRYHPVLQRISAWYLPKAEPETRVWLQALGALSEWNSEETRHQVAFWVGSFYGRLDWGSLWKLLRISVWEVSGLSTWRWKKKYLSTSTHPWLIKSCLLGYWVQTEFPQTSGQKGETQPGEAHGLHSSFSAFLCLLWQWLFEVYRPVVL